MCGLPIQSLLDNNSCHARDNSEMQCCFLSKWKKCYGDEKFYKHFFLGDLELEDKTPEGFAISIVEFGDNTVYILPDRRYV